MNNKGNALIDGPVLIVLLLGFALVGVVGLMVFSNMNTDFQADLTGDTNAKNTMSAGLSSYTNWVDDAFLMILVLFSLFLIISVFFLDSHPIYFILVFIMLVGVFIVGIFLANTYNDLASDATLSTFANQLPKISYIMSHLVETIIVIMFMVSTAMYIKFKS